MKWALNFFPGPTDDIIKRARDYAFAMTSKCWFVLDYCVHFKETIHVWIDVFQITDSCRILDSFLCVLDSWRIQRNLAVRIQKYLVFRIFFLWGRGRTTSISEEKPSCLAEFVSNRYSFNHELEKHRLCTIRQKIKWTTHPIIVTSNWARSHFTRHTRLETQRFWKWWFSEYFVLSDNWVAHNCFQKPNAWLEIQGETTGSSRLESHGVISTEKQRNPLVFSRMGPTEIIWRALASVGFYWDLSNC